MTFGQLFAWALPDAVSVPFEHWRTAAHAASERGLLLFDDGLPDDSGEARSDDSTVGDAGGLVWPAIDRQYIELFRGHLNKSC